MKRWRVWILVGGVAATVGLLLFTTGAGAATRKTVPKLWGGGACRSLMSDPAAVKDMQALRAEHRADMQAWWQKYGSDASSAAAQDALRQLREEHWNDMQQLFKKHGITPPSRASGQGGPGMMGGGPGGCAGAGGAGAGAGGCLGGTATPGTSGGGTSYGPGMIGGASGGMMGQSL